MNTSLCYLYKSSIKKFLRVLYLIFISDFQPSHREHHWAQECLLNGQNSSLYPLICKFSLFTSLKRMKKKKKNTNTEFSSLTLPTKTWQYYGRDLSKEQQSWGLELFHALCFSELNTQTNDTGKTHRHSPVVSFTSWKRVKKLLRARAWKRG